MFVNYKCKANVCKLIIVNCIFVYCELCSAFEIGNSRLWIVHCKCKWIISMFKASQEIVLERAAVIALLFVQNFPDLLISSKQALTIAIVTGQ